jgi:peptidoglycan/xylan/chitin deacetylase (PgdA/CDA1 family)
VAQLGKRVFPTGLWEGPADRRWVSLTFDDGPHPLITAQILEGLRRAGARAAFFLVGRFAERHTDLVRRIRDEGHEVGNHTWNHMPLSLGCGFPHGALARTEELLTRLVPGTLRIARPPFGALGPGGAAAIVGNGLLPIYWSVVPADWDPLPAAEVERRVLAEVHPGAVVVLHGGMMKHSGTAEAVEGLVHRLRDQGYEIAPLPEMLRASGLQADTR